MTFLVRALKGLSFIEIFSCLNDFAGEIAHLRQKERSLAKKRKEALNKILDIKGS